ncbi:hypothetical protein ACHAXR_008483 [Thalassiosira sp. AJA248-18]
MMNLARSILFTVILAGPYSPMTSAFLSHHSAPTHHHRPIFQLPKIITSSKNNHEILTKTSGRSMMMMMMARYGPTDAQLPKDSNNNNDDDNVDNKRNQLKSEFTTLLQTIINGTTPEEEYPSLFTQNIEMIFNVLGNVEEGGGGGNKLLEEIIQEVVVHNAAIAASAAVGGVVSSEISSSSSSSRLDQVSEAVNLILSFVETFVEQTKSMDDVYKQLLGTIFVSIAPTTGNANATKATTLSSSASAMENQLDDLLSQEKDAFTPGFLRHVEGECDRIAGLSTISPESAKMLQILRLIQTRVLEELGKGIGEGAIVLGQLLGYENEAERLAVLDAGLAVRGVDFAHELAALTEEALEGFKAVPEGGVDPELVKSVEVIDERIRTFIGKMDFQ